MKNLFLKVFALIACIIVLVGSVSMPASAGITSSMDKPAPLYNPHVTHVYTGSYTHSTATCYKCPAGWSVVENGVGLYEITHNLGFGINNKNDLVCSFFINWIGAENSTLMTYAGKGTNSIEIYGFNGMTEDLKHMSFDFICYLRT